MAVASPPAERISRSTVLMVEALEVGSGGKGAVWSLSLLCDFAATTTAYPFAAKSMATCLPIPLDAPTTSATGF